MFAVNKDRLAKTLHDMQRNVCAYDGGKDRAPDFCDCKYGWEGNKFYDYQTEQTGCPELRLAELLISTMTEEEYNELLKRSRSIIVG